MTIDELTAAAQERLLTPQNGGRPTDPSWTERRQVPMTADALDRLERRRRSGDLVKVMSPRRAKRLAKKRRRRASYVGPKFPKDSIAGPRGGTRGFRLMMEAGLARGLQAYAELRQAGASVEDATRLSIAANPPFPPEGT